MKFFIWLSFCIVAALARGFLIHTFYGWFILPHWPQAPHLGMAACLGLAYFVSVLSPWWFNSSDDEDDFEESMKKGSVKTFLYMILLFISGAIIKIIM